ncbi:hypothetical protein X737_35310 [Mesorhizobium sp. L48C026A00]|nr:hypothetical protein X737_35310 [Mesorhizobium sp. L48C026A00]
MAAQIIRDDDVAAPQDRNKLLTDIGAEAFAIDGTSKTQGAVSSSQRKALRKVMVRQWPCGAKLRSRCPFGPQPRSGDMLALSRGE